jgi:hypothetical protein
MVSLGLAGMAIAAAVVVSSLQSPQQTEVSDDYRVETDPCFRYGRFECCVRPGED